MPFPPAPCPRAQKGVHCLCQQCSQNLTYLAGSSFNNVPTQYYAPADNHPVVNRTRSSWQPNTASIPAYQMLGNTDRQINRLEPAHEQVIDHLARKSTSQYRPAPQYAPFIAIDSGDENENGTNNARQVPEDTQRRDLNKNKQHDDSKKQSHQKRSKSKQ